jgi:predicted DNA-binding protein YlxM (UPF0122 family)
MAQNISNKISNQIIRIPVDDIRLNPDDPRSEEAVDMSLMSSLKKSGQTDPGTFWVVDGLKTVLSGNRRLNALKTYQAALREKGSSDVIYFEAREFHGTLEESRQLTALANSYRKDFTTRQKAALIYKYQQDGMDAKEIAVAFGLKNAAEIYDILKVLESSHAGELYELEEAGVVAPTLVKKLARDPNPQQKIEELKKIANQQRAIASRAPKTPDENTAAEGEGGEAKPKKQKKIAASAVLGVYKINCYFTNEDLKRITAHPGCPNDVAAFIAHALLQDPEALPLIKGFLPEDLQETGKSTNPALKKLAVDAAAAEAANAAEAAEAAIPTSEAVDSDGDDSDDETEAAFGQAING